ncbi:LysR family transcriptional regulator [Xenophilus arseniciresistens]|uniref:LysR family transcriptional regulator n=1 Tax=Xenophilus arseniciresistens TaxID=1283306 RepID=A0AAE3N6Z0_9BURK|nr:LysR family transcriptional regulator [Xenophilus arseniciresistens]MDA7415077.1 LysR family transcriptional regulator [Xenophilus arseniciresistens]
MRFDLTDLRLFVHVVEAGSLTAGAARAHMTLASASQRVRGMEETLGGALLQRHPQGVRVTEAGRTLLHHARLVLAQMQRLRGELAEYGEGLRGHVRLLCNSSAIMEHLPAPLAAFLAAHPQLSVDVEERPSADVAQAVRAGLCELGICADQADLQGLTHHFFRDDALMLVLPRAHALASHAGAHTLDALKDARGSIDLVGLAADNPLQAHLSQQAARQGLQLRYRVRVRSFEAVCRMVEQGIAAAVVPRTAALRCAATLAIACLPLSEAWAQRTLVICVKEPQRLAPHAQRLLQHLLAPELNGA